MVGLRIDRSVYNDACIAKAVYSLSDKYAINRKIDGESELLQISPIGNEDEQAMAQAVLSALNDYKLRQIIEQETHDIRTILYAKAFANFDDIDIDDV